MEKKLYILELSEEEERIAKAWAKAYGTSIEELYNIMLNKLETGRFDITTAFARLIIGDLSLD